MFNVLIDNKPFFDQPVKNKQEAYEKLIEMSRNGDYATGNLLAFSYHQSYHKFVTRKWNIVNDNSKLNRDATDEITYNLEITESNLCDYKDAYILVSGDITEVAAPATQVAFTNSAPFTKCIIQIDETTIDDAEDLDLVMPMHNLIQYSSYYSETTGSLWFYF